MLRNKKYGMGGAVQSFSSPMLAQGMQGGLSGFGTSGLQTFAKGGRMSNVEMERMKIKDWYKKNFKTDELGDELNPNTTFDDLFSAILNGDVYSAMGVHDSVVRERLFSKLSKIKGRYENYAYELYVKYGDKPLGSYAKGGEIIDQYEGKTPADIWFNLTKSQRRHLLLDHANIPSNELSSYIGDDTSFDELPHFVKQVVKKHFAEGQYARGGKLSPAQERAFFGKTKTKFTESDAERLVGKFIEIYGQGQDEPIAFSKIAKATIDPKYSQKTLVIYTEMGTQERIPEDKIDAFYNGLTIVLSIPSKGSYYGLKLKKEAYEYAEGGKTRKSGNVPRIAKKVAEVNALIEKGNELGVEVVDSSTTWQSPMKYKPIKYVNGILYIEYEELDLYSHLKRGINQWKLKKDKVLKRNMEFDNPLNDIAKMYRKAIREREQYFADGGNVQDMDRYSSARTMGRDTQNWEAELKEYAGEHYNSLTRQEREEIIADMQRDFDRNTHFADGGVVIYKETDLNRRDGKTKIVQVTKVDSYREALERIEELKNNNKNTNVRFFTGNIYAKGGQTSTYEVHLEAVPNRDFDQASHEANVRVPKLKKSAKSVAEAVSIAKKFIQDNDLGGSNFLPAKLYKNGKQIGFISYNGRVWNNDQSEMKYAKGGQTEIKRSRITLIMDGQKYSYPVAIVNGRVEITEETFKDGVVREYLDKEFDLWLKQAPTDYEEMYYGDEDVMSKSGAIEGAMEIVISTIEEEAPKKMTFNFDEGDVEFYEAYQYARGGEISVSDDEKRKSLKGNLKIKF